MKFCICEKNGELIVCFRGKEVARLNVHLAWALSVLFDQYFEETELRERLHARRN